MKPDTHLGVNARQIEVSNDQRTPFLFAVFKCEADDLVLKQNYSYQWRASARSGREKLNAVSGLIDHYNRSSDSARIS